MNLPWRTPALAAGILTLALAESALGAAKTYSYDDSGAAGGPFSGTGVFVIDIEDALGDYTSSSAAGFGDSFGVWNSVTFRASFGNRPGIVISNTLSISNLVEFDALGGGVLEFGASALAEWDHLLKQLNAQGYRVAEIGTPVPEASTWLSVAGLGAAGALLLRRRS